MQFVLYLTTELHLIWMCIPRSESILINVYNIGNVDDAAHSFYSTGKKHPNNKLSGQVMPREQIRIMDFDTLDTLQKWQTFFSKLNAWSTNLLSGSSCIANLRLQVHATNDYHEEIKLYIFQVHFAKNDTVTHHTDAETISYFEVPHYRFHDISSNGSKASFIKAIDGKRMKKGVLAIELETRNEFSFLKFHLYFGNLQEMFRKPSFSWAVIFNGNNLMEIRAWYIQSGTEDPRVYSTKQKSNLFEGQLIVYQLPTMQSAELSESPIFEEGIISMSFSKQGTNITEQHGAQFGKTFADWNAVRTFDMIGLRAFRNRVIHDERTNLQHEVTDTFQLILKDMNWLGSSKNVAKFEVKSFEFSIVHEKDEHTASDSFSDDDRDYMVYLNKLLDERYVIKGDTELKVENIPTSDAEGYNTIIKLTLSMDLKFNKSQKVILFTWELKFQGSSPDRDDETEGSREFIKLTVFVPRYKYDYSDPMWSTDDRNALVLVEVPKKSEVSE